MPADHSKVLSDANLLFAFLSFCFPVWFVSVQHIFCGFVEVLREVLFGKCEMSQKIGQ